jgi:KUP system potassium uptake protein
MSAASGDTTSRRRRLRLLALGALGIVFGDIGTSPLYTLSVCFQFSGVPANRENLLGICSLLVWVLVIVVCIKYATFILRADHDGEGGILALLALAGRRAGRYAPIGGGLLTLVVIVGAAMLLGDGMITPAISVISAVEGLNVVTPAAERFVVPISVVILLALFALQSKGTETVGRLFGPVMLLWFVSIAVAGAFGIAVAPEIAWAVDPRHGIAFLFGHGIFGFLVLGGVVLAVTGVEALYADLSHFGRAPILVAWYVVVFPALVLCYLGQGARVLHDPHVLAQSFFALSPGWTLIPMIVIATIATVIASQALISGAFTLVEQSVALGLCPRMLIRHTSSVLRGQVYVPAVNRALAVGCIALVIGFGSSARLAAAFGLAVSCTMLATSFAYYAVARRVWKWPPGVALPLALVFLAIDGSFVLAGLPKIASGGWIPFAVATVLTLAATTWLEGRRCVADALRAQETPLDKCREFFTQRSTSAAARPLMVVLTGDPDQVPFLASHAWVRERASEERVLLLTLLPSAIPYVAPDDRVTVSKLGALTRVVARFGYMELPNIAPIAEACKHFGISLDEVDTSFFYADPKIEPAAVDAFPAWRRELFSFLRLLARPLPDDLHIVAERRVELGVTVRI